VFKSALETYKAVIDEKLQTLEEEDAAKGSQTETMAERPVGRPVDGLQVEASTEVPVRKQLEEIQCLLSFTKQLLKNAVLKHKSQRRYSFEFIRLCSTLKVYSLCAYLFLRNFLCDTLPHPHTLRNFASANDIKCGIDERHFESLHKQSLSLPDAWKNVQVNMLYTQIILKQRFY
jgi:hypothetical protein